MNTLIWHDFRFHDVSNIMYNLLSRIKALNPKVIDLLHGLISNWLLSRQKYFTFFIVIFLYRPSISGVSNTIWLELLAVVEGVTAVDTVSRVEMGEVMVTSSLPVGVCCSVVSVVSTVAVIIGDVGAALSADRNVSRSVSTVALPESRSYYRSWVEKSTNLFIITYFNGEPLISTPDTERSLRLNSLWQARSCLQPFST